MRRIICILCMACSFALVHAQDNKPNDHRKIFDEFRKSIRKDFDSFREQCMKEYIDFVKEAWDKYNSNEPITKPEEKPVPPVVVPEEEIDKPIEDKPIVIEEVIEPIIEIEPQPEPVEPIKEIPVIKPKTVDFIFYGSKGTVRFDTAKRPILTAVNENSVANTLASMNAADYDNMLYDCLKIREDRQLCDWAYMQMLVQLSQTICGTDINSSRLLFAYLFLNSGYKVRFATEGNKLYVLYASKSYIYDQRYFTIDGQQYYCIDEMPSQLYICRASFPREKSASMTINSQQHFDFNGNDARRIASERYPEVNATISVNKNLIDFYDKFPTSMLDGNMMTRWAIYANTPIDKNIKDELYPQLRQAISGLSKAEAAQRLLNFVQTGFPYGYDSEIWGGDRAFFAEESLYYPFSDCEDHSILLTRLVRDLLGLKCILIYYPGHLASAIEIPGDEVTGDYIMLNGHKYIVADGTYIGAPLGMTMPGMDNSSAKVILLE